MFNLPFTLLAGVALSFDEVIVTIFMAGGLKTLPIWIFQSFRLANQVPLVNVADRSPSIEGCPRPVADSRVTRPSWCPVLP